MEYEKNYFTIIGYRPYFDFPAHKIRAEKIMNIAHPHSVLDVGCAYGYIVKHLLDEGIHSVGMEISKWCESRRIIPDNFITHDMRVAPYPFKDKEFDLVYCEGVLEHIEEEYIPDIMKEFERISKERMIQVTFEDHPNATQEAGHLCIHDFQWWLDRIPDYTWLFITPTGTDGGNVWIYKG